MFGLYKNVFTALVGK